MGEVHDLRNDASIRHLIDKVSGCRVDQSLRETVRQTLYAANFYACERCGLVIKTRFGKRGIRIPVDRAKWLNALSRDAVVEWLMRNDPVTGQPLQLLDAEEGRRTVAYVIAAVRARGEDWAREVVREGIATGVAEKEPLLYRAFAELIDPAKLIELLAHEARRHGFHVYSEDPGDSLLLPCILAETNELGLWVEVFANWQECRAEPHVRGLETHEARADLAALIPLPDGSREQAERILRGVQ
jgi:hypothetical protein